MVIVLRWNTLAVAVLVGIAIVTAVWWAGPGVLGTAAAAQGTVAQATVTKGAECTAPNPQETVEITVDGRTRTGILDACGHDQNDRVDVTVPASAGDGEIQVHLADVVTGHDDLRRPIGLALLALSCLGGGTYAFLIHRGPRRAEIPAAS
ncbi:MULTISPECIES: hypothetical protein [Amycolatopsis]|uniref:Integral membrane protein n=1 Tax=Amycolatopsis thermalba TaxID=944492 RepID=A0ABY4NRM5_9PSEU|nr:MULTISPECIES: hypothetical protein [Amycolatopsis]OXM68304.1 hypothetical protein CF166_22960 [Amycolatopsis sp. KNN50.9b]UQS22716.1 hypothetical protein L1857_07735 [Amycolatopsis thermalba]